MWGFDAQDGTGMVLRFFILFGGGIIQYVPGLQLMYDMTDRGMQRILWQELCGGGRDREVRLTVAVARMVIAWKTREFSPIGRSIVVLPSAVADLFE